LNLHPALYLPVALKLHAYGLFRLQDSEWCGTDLYQRAKRPYRGRDEPRYLFQKPLPDGFLFQLGSWLFEDYLESDDFFHLRDVEFLREYIDDFRQLLICGGVPRDDALLHRIGLFIGHLERADGNIGTEERGRAQRDSYALKVLHQRIWEKFTTSLLELRTVYARNYAERVFHDRQLCGYIAQIILDMGIDGTTGDEEPSQWCLRLAFPVWVKNALIARERGKCAACAADLLLELNGVVHIDHIIPLASGGCNDLVNLQILCDSCNLKKSTGVWPVTSSVPPYLERALKKRNRSKS
jgi:hypothetical protein